MFWVQIRLTVLVSSLHSNDISLGKYSLKLLCCKSSFNDLRVLPPLSVLDFCAPSTGCNFQAYNALSKALFVSGTESFFRAPVDYFAITLHSHQHLAAVVAEGDSQWPLKTAEIALQLQYCQSLKQPITNGHASQLEAMCHTPLTALQPLGRHCVAVYQRSVSCKINSRNAVTSRKISSVGIISENLPVFEIICTPRRFAKIHI